MEYDNEAHVKWMQLALTFAERAAALGEVPVGAVITHGDNFLVGGYNRRETDKNGLAHAELLAIEQACGMLGGWRLHQCQLYVTLEPCPMCAGAIVNTRIPLVVYGASDPKAGCYGSLTDFNALPFNHKPVVVAGVLEQECSHILTSFFKQLRQK